MTNDGLGPFLSIIAMLKIFPMDETSAYEKYAYAKYA